MSREGSARAQAIPWLTCVLALACAAGFMASHLVSLETWSWAESRLDAAADYFEARPYLELPPLLASRFPGSWVEELRARDEEARLERAAPELPPRILEAGQVELDEMVLAVQQRLDALPEQRFGLSAVHPRPLAWLGHLALHGGWLHLVGNLALLLLLGTHLERGLGPLRLAGVVVAATLGAGGLFVAGNPGLEAPLIGSSGLVLGLAAAFAVWFQREPDRVPYGASLLLAAVVVLPPLLLGWEWSVARGPGAARAASLTWLPSCWALAGGFGGGTASALLLRALAPAAAPQRAAAQRGGPAGSDPLLPRAHALRAQGRSEEAFALLTEMVRKRPGDFAAAEALWDVANDVGRSAEAAPAILAVIREAIRTGDRGRAVRRWLELTACSLDGAAEPALLTRMATLLRDAGERDASVRAFDTALQRADGAAGSTVASRVAREAAAVDPGTSARAAWKALASPELGLEDRQNLEGLLGELQPKLAALGVEVTSPPPAAKAPFEEDTRPDPIDFEDRSRWLEVVEARPVEIDDEGLHIEVEGGGKKRVRFDRIEALAVVGVEGLGPRPILLVDLVLNWRGAALDPLRIIRMRTDRFDPRRLVQDVPEPREAFLALVGRLLRGSGATPLPDAQSVRGQPFAAFADIQRYHRDVLSAADPAATH